MNNHPDVDADGSEMPARDLESAIAELDRIRELLPFLVTVTPEQREQMTLPPDFADFDAACARAMAAHPEFLPPGVSLAELEEKRAQLARLKRVTQEIGALRQSISDTLLVADSAAWPDELAFFRHVREMARSGQTQAKAAIDDLRRRFPLDPTASTPADPDES